MSRRALFTVMVLVTLAVVVVAYRPGTATPGGDDKDIAAVRAVIEAQQAAWNRGDVAGYMEGYAKTSATTFVSGDTVTRGWQTVLDRYKARYDTREKMGTLAFTELEFKPLCASCILVMGRWELTRTGDTPRGRFTLIFERTNAGWRIVHDHTSSAS
ncbi:MAG: YybH family protein [Bacteroidales bacterium]